MYTQAAAERLAVFSLVSGLETEAEQVRLLATRSCAVRAIGPNVRFDHVIFHDGVPLSRRQDLSALVEGGLRFVDAREYGGFTRVPRLRWPLAHDALGYRHSKRQPTTHSPLALSPIPLLPQAKLPPH